MREPRVDFSLVTSHFSFSPSSLTNFYFTNYNKECMGFHVRMLRNSEIKMLNSLPNMLVSLLFVWGIVSSVPPIGGDVGVLM